MRNCLRQIDFSSVILQFAWGFSLSTVKLLICLRQLDANWVIIFSAWGFFSYHVLKGYMFWNDGVSTSWFFRPPEAFSRIMYWRDISLEAMAPRRLDSSVCLRLFLYHVLNRYVSWSDGVSTTWFFRPPEAFSYITYWRDTYPKGNWR